MSYLVKMNLDQSEGLILCSATLESKKTSNSSVAGKTVWKKFKKITLIKIKIFDKPVNLKISIFKTCKLLS